MSPPSRRHQSIMIWACVSIKGKGNLTDVEGNINARKYIEILDNNLSPVLARHFPDNQYVLKCFTVH